MIAAQQPRQRSPQVDPRAEANGQAGRDPGQRFPKVDLRAEANGRAGRYLSLLGLVGVPADVYDISGVAGIPAFACCSRGETIAYTTAVHRSAALTEALGLLLLAYQSRANGQRELRPGPVPQLPASVLGTEAPTSPQPVGTAGDTTALAAAVRRMGRVPVVVPLGHDPAMSAVMPFTAHVVGLWRPDSGVTHEN
jgi:hypothetical protein